MRCKKIILTSVALLIILISSLILILRKNSITFEIENEFVYINYGDEIDTSKYNAKICNDFLKSICKDLNEFVISEVKNNSNISYTIEYKLNYKEYNKTLIQNVEVVDKEKPSISINSDNLCGNLDGIYQVIDNVDGDITQNVIISNKDENICFSVKDSSGNENEVCKNKYANDKTKPTISLKGNSTLYLLLNDQYKEPGYSATDNCEGNITNKVKIYSNLNTNTPGKYTIKYSVKDKNNNETTVTRNVVIYKSFDDIEKNGKVIYLTFDDGPNQYTDDILNVLKKYNIKATFFVTNQFPKYQNLIGKASAEGHAIAIHSYSHQYKNIYSSVDNYFYDLTKMNEIIEKQTGKYSDLVRFPGGSSNTISNFNKGIMTKLSKKVEELGYTYFDWNVDSKDTTTTNSNTIANNVIKGISQKNYSVILMHDIKKANIESVELIIQYGLLNGYTFKTLTTSSPTAHHGIRN